MQTEALTLTLNINNQKPKNPLGGSMSMSMSMSMPRILGNKDYYVVIKTFTNSLAKQGKLEKAKKIISKIAYYVKLHKDIPLHLFLYRAILNVRPSVGIGINKTGSGATNQKPQLVPLAMSRGNQLAIRWLIQGAKQRATRTMALSMFQELKDAYNNKGYAWKKKNEWHSRLLSSQLKSYSFQKTK